MLRFDGVRADQVSAEMVEYMKVCFARTVTPNQILMADMCNSKSRRYDRPHLPERRNAPARCDKQPQQHEILSGTLD